MLIFLLAILGDVGDSLVDRYNFLRTKITPAQYNLGLFLFLSAFSALSLILFFGENDFSPAAWGWLLAVVVVATIWNIGYAKALSKENLEEIESFILFTPLLTTILARIFLREYNEKIFIASLVASLAFIFSHLKKSHLDLHKRQKYLAGVVALMSFESIIIKQALVYFSPALLYTLRTTIIWLVFALMYGGQAKYISSKSWKLLALSGALGAMYKIAQFAGFSSFGVIYTTLVLILAPFLILLFDRLWLNEKLHWRYILSIIIIIGAIIYATIR